MGMRHAIFGCRLTMQCYQLNCSRFRAYIPLERYWFNGVLHNRPAMPGVLFVPWRNAAAFRRAQPEHFNIRQFYWRLSMLPAFVEVEELEAMQRAINAQFEAREVVSTVATEWFNIGDEVDIVSGPLSGFSGRISRIKSNGKFRLFIGNNLLSYVEIDRQLVRKAAVYRAE